MSAEAAPHPMDAFCGSVFWNTTLTWHSEDPFFTRCFEHTVLVWAPCAFLWSLAILDVFYMRSSMNRHVPWGWLNLSKLLVTGALCVLTLVDLGRAAATADADAVHPVDIWTPAIKVLTFLLSGALMIFNQRRGLRTSGLVFLFWLLLVICAIPQMRTESRLHAERDAATYESYRFISFILFFAGSSVMVLLNCWADAEPRVTKYPTSANPCPEQQSSFLSKIFFAWFDRMAWKGYRNPLEHKDLWDMNPEDTCKEVMPLFAKHWNLSVARANAKNAAAAATATSNATRGNGATSKLSYEKASSTVNIDRITGPAKSSTAQPHTASILPAICKAFGPIFLFGSALKLAQDALTFVSPQVLRLIIQFVSSGQSDGENAAEPEPMWRGIFYAVLLFVVACVQTLFLGQYFQRMFVVGLRIRTALISAIYRKAMRLSNASRKESTVGEIVNLMSVDAQRFMDLTTYINMLWSAPLQIGLALYFLWDILGPSVLAGLAVMIILIPVNAFIANKIKDLQIRQMKNKDERVKLMNEVLNGIKVLKLYAWERSFEEQVLQIREKEIKVLKEAAYLSAGTSFIWSCAPFLVAAITFATYVLSDPANILTVEKAFVCLTLFDIIRLPLVMFPLVLVYVIEVALVTFGVFVVIDEKNVLNAEIAFVSLSLFNILRFPLSMLPMLISNMVQTAVSVKRINKFMNSEELDPDSVQHDAKENATLLIDHGTFSWGDDDVVLRDIQLAINRGQLAAVVGTVGSGKSSLISALLGEMDKIGGRVNTQGSVAYVSQQAWIQNCTLQDNILFGRPMNRAAYDRVVQACALKPDIEMLPAGDQTEIGEKGINLSGGQKQRVSLARAVYNDADVYLLDDPLSAVDAHVSKHIFEQVIGPGGLLAGKTRVLVTHGITFLPQVDNIVVLKAGEISEQGSYEQLMSSKGAFAEFLIAHLQEIGEQADEASDAELVDLKAQLEATLTQANEAASAGEAGASDKAELLGQLERVMLRRSESRSETASAEEATLSASGALTRQTSADETGSLTELRKRRSLSRTPSKTSVKSAEKPAEKNTLIEQEKSEVGSVKWAVYKHYLKSIGVWLSLATVLLNIVFQAFAIGSNVWLSKWSVDKSAGNDTSVRDMYLGVYGVFGLGQVMSISLATLCLYMGGLRAARTMHRQMLTAVVRSPMTTFFDVTPVGRILNRFSHDVDEVDNEFPSVIRGFCNCFFSVIATITVISMSTSSFLIVIIPIAILYYFVQRFYVATSRQLKRLESVSRSPIYSHFGESIQGCQTIRAYTVQERFIQESEAKVDFNQVCYYPGTIANRWLAVRLEMVGNCIILFAALFAVLSRDTIDAGLVGLSVSYALQVTQTLNWLVRMTSDVETNIVAVERIKEYGETKQEAAWDLPNKTLPALWPETGAVEFRDFEVRYREGLELVLRGLTFAVRGGEKVGIVGRTGAGKSSLTLALFRIIESAGGRIIIDGEDIAQLGLHALRSRLTIIPQDPVLFSGSLRMNLDPFGVKSDDEVWRALEHAHLAVFVRGLAAGLNHEVTEGGENLSVGQRQLVCLARALLRKTKVLILDEATAAVDLETDDLIQKTIRTEFASCTVLTIAHRLNTILDSDKVIVLDKGRIAEFDAPQKLLHDRKSAFYSMAKDAGLV